MDTTTATKREPQRKPLQPLKPKYIFTFAVFGLRKYRENTKRPQRKSNFCPFLPKICPDRLKICHDGAGKAGGLRSRSREQRKAATGAKKSPSVIERAYNKGHPPPPFAERQVHFIPTIFRTKNTEKSQPQRKGWCRKFFGNFFGGMFRVKKCPQLGGGRGRG